MTTSQTTGRLKTVRRFESLHILTAATRTRAGGIGLALTVIVLAVAFVGPFIAPHDPNAVGLVPAFDKPSGDALLGGDSLGRDVLSRTLSGGWQIILLAAFATALGIGVGAAAGIAAAYLTGWVDNVIMRAVDVVLAFPQLVFALLLVSVLGSHLWLLVVAVGVSHAPQVARVIRAASLDVAERDYVKAVAITGAKPSKVMRREILPNLITPLMVEGGLRMTFSIIIMAGLAFLGFGFQPPNANWGYMINENRIGASLNPWAIMAPAVLLAILAVGINTFADAVTRAALGVDRTTRAAVAADPVNPSAAAELADQPRRMEER